MYFAQNVKYLREQKRLSQQAFAEEIGLHCSAVCKWENGYSVPDIEMIIRVAEYFDVSLDDFVLKDLRPPLPVYVRNLRFLRKKHGMTQGDIGNLIGVTQKV